MSAFGPRFVVHEQHDLFGTSYIGQWYLQGGAVRRTIAEVQPQPSIAAAVSKVLRIWPNAEHVDSDGRPVPPPKPLRPSLPYTSGSATSRAAAEQAAYSADTQKGRIYAYLRDRGADGATNSELVDVLHLPIQSVSTRVSQMHADGTITYAGVTRTALGTQAEQEVHIAVLDGIPAGGSKGREMRSERYERLGNNLHRLLILEVHGDSDRLNEIADALHAWENRDATT